MRPSLPTLMLVVVATVGCPSEEEDTSPDATAVVHISSDSLDLGQLVAGQSGSDTLILTSMGTAPLVVQAITVVGDDAFTTAHSAIAQPLESGEQTTVVVICSPTTDGPLQATLVVESNDPDRPDAEVSLACSGLAPVLDVAPAEVDFGTVAVGCEAEVEVSLANTGSVAFELNDLVFAPTSDELLISYFFQLGGALDPGQSEEVTLGYRPADELPDSGYLRVYTDIPTQPEAVVTIAGTGELGAEVVDEYVQTGTNQTDIVWLINDTASMADELGMSLSVNLQSFIDIIDVLGIDWQMTVATSSDPVFRGLDFDIEPTGASEAGLASSWEALSPPLAAPGGPNDGFLREYAGLRVIYVSDEDDGSPDTVAHYVQMLQWLKANPDHVVLSAIVAENDSARYQAAVGQTGGLAAFWGNGNWVNALSNMAWLCISWQDTFELSHDPVPETLTVWLDGVPVYEGWYYDVVLNAVVFDPDYVPDTGVEVVLTYHAAAVC